MTSTPARQRLLDAAVRRIGHDGPLNATLDDIRTEAGASVGAVYHHFPDKGALWAAAHADALARYQQAFVAELERHAAPRDGVRAIVAFHVAWCADNEDAARLLLAGRPPQSSATPLNKDFFARVGAWWRAHAHHGAVRDLDIGLLHALWLGPAMDLTRHWLAGREPQPSDEAVAVLADAAWSSLRTERSTP